MNPSLGLGSAILGFNAPAGRGRDSAPGYQAGNSLG